MKLTKFLFFFMAFVVRVSGAVNGNCSALPLNSICGAAFAGFPIGNQSVEAFNNNLINYVANTSTLATTLVSQNVCAGGQGILDKVQTLRYQVSFQCAYFVSLAVQAGCPIPQGSLQVNGPLLCPAQCNLAVSTVQALASNTTLCPNGKSIAVQSYSDYCNSLANLIPQNRNLCNSGSTAESKFCGFFDQATAATQCSSLSEDSCCKALLSDKGSSSSKLVIIVVASILSGLVAIGVVLWFIYLSRKRRSMASRGASSPEPYGGPSSKAATNNVGPDFYVKPPPLSFDKPEDEDDNRGGNTLSRVKLPSFIQDNRFSELYTAASVADLRKSNLRPDSNYTTITTTKTKDGSNAIGLSDLPPGSKKMLVVHAYSSDMDDELDITPGMSVYMVRAFDDGWALGVDPQTGLQGAFPMICVQDLGADRSSLYSSYLDRNSIGHRQSSMLIRNSLPQKNSKSKVPFSLYLDQLDKYDADNLSP